MTAPFPCRPRETVELLAWRVTDDNYQQVTDWVSGTGLSDTAPPVEPGDYVLRGITGKFFRCTPAVFEETYEVINR